MWRPGGEETYQGEFLPALGVNLGRWLATGSKLVHPVDNYDVGEVLQSIQSLGQAAIHHNFRNNFFPVLPYRLLDFTFDEAYCF